MEIKSYSPEDVNISINGRIITGFATDNMINVSRNEDSATPVVDVKGAAITYVKNGNRSGTIAITVSSNSSSVSFLRSLANDGTDFPVLITDANDDSRITISAQRCRILKMADISRGKNLADETFNIFVPELNIR